MNILRQSKVEDGFPLNSGRTNRISKFKQFSKMTFDLTPFQKIQTLWKFVICLERFDGGIMKWKQSDLREYTDLLSFLSHFLTSIC